MRTTTSCLRALSAGGIVWAMKMGGQAVRNFTVLLAALVALFVSGTASAQQPHTLTGDIRVHKGFHSKLLNNDRDVVVYLPPGYEATKKVRYAVLYLHDGQNLFDGATLSFSFPDKSGGSTRRHRR